MKSIAISAMNLAILCPESGMIVAMTAGVEPKLSPMMVTTLVESSKASFRKFQQTQRIDQVFGNRRLDDEQPTCEQSLINCIKNDKCAGCFKAMGEKSIDFTTLAHGTTCDEVIDPIIEKGICNKDIKTDKTGFGAFCESVNSCAVKEKDDIQYYDDDDDDDADDFTNTTIDCNTLTECKWDGFKASYIGDGACQSWGCYNSAICDYDGGDCCEDTCKNTENDLVKCGSDGYVCVDPKSSMNKDSDKKDKKDKDKTEKKCKDNEIGVQLLKFASFGGGWGEASMTIARKGNTKNESTYKGTMEDGASSKELICLPNEPACYDVKLNGGIWGNRVSWQIKPLKEGGPDIASGGAPLQCQFPMGGGDCESTCNGQSDSDSTAGAGGGELDDDSYHSYEAMQHCIESKCLIQLASCELSKTCNPCLAVERPYCYSDTSFAALVKCSLCNCVPDVGEEDEDKFEEFCAEDEIDGKGDDMPECTAENSKKGVFALFNYTSCISIDFETVTVTNYDNDHFGRLDSFENCVNTYTKDEYHGGNTALGCMRILQQAILDPSEEDSKTDPSGTIAKMAYHLYEDAETFCDCSAKTSAACPACKGFKNFKTLLYESLDACRALDLIDCAAWSEFSAPCQKNMETKFGKSTFSDKAQCDYVIEGCGGVGPFPSFRHFDCESESGDKEAWHFYEAYANGCLGGDSSNDGKKGIKPLPIKPYKPPQQKATAAPTRRYVPYGSDDDKAVPLEPKANESSGSASASDDRKSKGSKFKSFMKFLLFCILCGGGYWYYKRTREFDYVRFRRARNYGADSGMFEGSAMENSATSFEPPSLPPPPSSFQVSNNFA